MTAVVGPASRSRLGAMGAVRRGWDKTSSESETRTQRLPSFNGRQETIVWLSLAHRWSVPICDRRHKQSVEHDDSARDLAGHHPLEAFVDVGELVGPADQA